MSSWIESMYSCSSLIGLVSSKRRWQRPPNSCAIRKLSAIDFGWPMWRYPFGSGGKRVTTSETLPSRTSAATISRMKSLRSGVAGMSALTRLLLMISKRVMQYAAGPGAHPRCLRRAWAYAVDDSDDWCEKRGAMADVVGFLEEATS